MDLDNGSDEDFLGYVWGHSETERALFSREHILKLLKLANIPEGNFRIPPGPFISLSAEYAKPIVKRARRQLKRQTPQLELPFDSAKGAEDYLL